MYLIMLHSILHLELVSHCLPTCPPSALLNAPQEVPRTAGHKADGFLWNLAGKATEPTFNFGE